MKRRQLWLVVFVVMLFATMTFSQIAVGNFNAATGFSGKNGFTCTSCHNVPDAGPAGNEELYPQPAVVTLEGLPDAWNLGETYPLTIAVTGGPPALPEPAPQGGFEIETSQGVFTPIEETAHLIDVYHPDSLAVTYTVEGTLVREWTLAWTAPTLPLPPNVDNFGLRDELESAPTNIGFWVAAMAANGNHVVALGLGDGGELGDSVAALQVTVPPSQAAMGGWSEVRLTPPRLLEAETPIEVSAREPFSLRIQQTDARATHVAYRIDGGEWDTRAVANEWTMAFSDGLSDGEHVLEIRSESEELFSETMAIVILASVDEERVETPFMSAMASGAFLLVIAWRRRQ